jgi:hypothetical protein
LFAIVSGEGGLVLAREVVVEDEVVAVTAPWGKVLAVLVGPHSLLP